MIRMDQSGFKRRFTCGEHVKGRGRHVATNGQAISLRVDCAIAKGVIVMLPGKRGDPYTVLDEHTFITLESQEEEILPFS